MRIITKASEKDIYDRYSDPTDNLTVWVRTPSFISPSIISGNISSVLNRPKPGLKRIKDENFLLETEVYSSEKKGVLWSHRDLWNDDRFSSHLSSRPEDQWSLSTINLIFCGKLYRALRYQEKIATSEYKYALGYSIRSRVFWNAEALLEHFEEKEGRWLGHRPKQKLNSFFTPYEHPDIVDLSIERGCPLFYLAETTEPVEGNKPQHGYRHRELALVANANCLSDIQFSKVMDPHTMFQELSMYVGGVLVKPDKTSSMTNKEKIASHGMDATSFRKGPTKVHV